MTEEIKIVIVLKGDRGSVGIQSPDCDPVFATFEGDLGVALEKVPVLVEEANRRWDQNPKYPKCQTTLPEASQPAAAPARSAGAPRQNRTQPAMF